MIRCHASWVLPIGAPPMPGGWVVIDRPQGREAPGRDRIVACGAAAEPFRATTGPLREVDLGRVALLPGLVNAHTHLELSYLRDRVPAGASFVAWIRAMMAVRQGYPDPAAPEIMAGVEAGIAESLRDGTAAVGDISNTLVTSGPLASSLLDGVVFNEVIGFNPADPEALVARAADAIRGINAGGPGRASLAAHAPYSVAPAVLRAIAAAVDRDGLPACSVHLAESAEEVEFIRTGRGPWRQLLEDFGVWNPGWTAPGVSPVRYLDGLGFLTPRVLAVHGVQMTTADLSCLASHGATIVTCPRSNRYTGAGTPDVARLYASGVRVAVGTDSLASTPDLNVFSELAVMRALAPAVPASTLLDSATRQGARALGLEADYGTIASGKRARLIAVTLPAGVDDVEEYLVSGIDPGQIRWIEGE